MALKGWRAMVSDDHQGEPPTTVEIRFMVAELQTLTIRPGDRFVMHTDLVLTPDSLESIRRGWAEFAGTDTPLLVLDGGLKLGAIRVEDAVTIRLAQAAEHA